MKEAKVEKAPKGTYCAWCVGRTRSLELQQAGYTSEVCDEHYRKLCEEGGISLPPRITPAKPL